VTNDFEMENGGAIAVITGPNMAGKSTFLRTVGVNAVLAFAGGPVCAAALEIAPFRLAAGMKSTDSLDRRMSLFYAELERLKMILDAIRDHPGTFFIIDEMLKGTNEMDRHKGAMALMRQLIARRATGIVATHDLELTGLSAASPAVRNYHFDGNVVDDKLVFDFKLRPGICESFNALLLMKRIGIEV
jgi:DNA mismatch repair ATPase MutS